MKRKRGRPALPIEQHIMRGTFRPDRHGPRPALQMPKIRPSTPLPAASGTDDGSTFTASLLKTWSIDDVIGVQLAQAAGEALGRRQALDRLLDGPDGLIVRAAAGTASAAHLTALLQARKQSLDEFTDAIDRLELDNGASAESLLKVAR
jgi:hypothetical protein